MKLYACVTFAGITLIFGGMSVTFESVSLIFGGMSVTFLGGCHVRGHACNDCRQHYNVCGHVMFAGISRLRV